VHIIALIQKLRNVLTI